MVEDQLIRRGIQDTRLLEAFRRLPRERFVPKGFEGRAYEDRPLSIGEGQTISQPYIVALMLEQLKLAPGDHVLDIGTGSGYQAAVLAQMGIEVYSVERLPDLARVARQRLDGLGFSAVQIRVGDGSAGWPEQAPFQGIVVAASAPRIPAPLVQQLAPGGRMVLPVGEGISQMLIGVERTPQGLKREEICSCAFVPLVGRYGWA